MDATSRSGEDRTLPSSTPELDLEYKPDAAEACRRMAAWWEGEILDRPALQVCAPRAHPRPRPQKEHASQRERWFDVEYAVACADARAANTYWGGEILPAFWPNLGPDWMAACYGSELQFAKDTSWSSPSLKDWPALSRLAPREDNPYLRAVLEMIRLGLEVGRGKFIVGLTDLHPGGDLAAALRGYEQLNVDLVEEPERIHELLARIRSSFFDLYEKQHALLRAAGQRVTTTWLPLFCEGRYYPPCNDFSCMISTAMFKEFFLEELRAEMAWLDRSIYHLDGPQALRHLDTLLELEDLDAIQFVCGAGSSSSQWLPVFKRIQDAGKCLQVSVEPREVPLFMQALRPAGVMLTTWASSVAEADALIAQVSRWPGA